MEEIESDYRIVIEKLVTNTNANESLPCNIKVFATIRTTDDKPIWSKPYPYPMTAANFVSSEMKKNY